MSDTVKLIIEIPSNDYEYLKNNCIIPIKYDNHIYKAIINGTPLDAVKAEIRAKHFRIVEKNDFDNGRTYGYDECLSILDNIGKGEK